MFISDKLVPSSDISNTYRNCMNTLVNKISNLKLDLFFENHIFVYGLLPIPRISETVFLSVQNCWLSHFYKWPSIISSIGL